MSNEEFSTSLPKAVDYTSRDFFSIKDDLIKRVQDTNRMPNWVADDSSDFGVMLVESFAYLGDLMSYYIDRAANETSITTAVKPSSVLSLANSLGYRPVGYRQSSTAVTVSNSTELSVTFPAGTILTGSVTVADVTYQVYFTTTDDVTIFADDTATVTATHGKSISQYPVTTQNPNIDNYSYGELLDISTGEPNMLFELSEAPVVDGSVEVFVKDGDSYTEWSRVDYLMDSDSTDLVFTTFFTDNGTYFVQFGDGVSGAIPASNAYIQARYIVGGGVEGNIPADTLNEVTYVPGLSTEELVFPGITFTNDSTDNGYDPEPLEQIRIAAPLAYRAGNRAVTIQDFESLALQVPDVGKAKAVATSPTAVTMYIAPTRGNADNDPNPGIRNSGSEISPVWQSNQVALKADVAAYLGDKTLIGTTLTMADPTYVDVYLEISYKKLDQFSTIAVEDNIIKKILLDYNYAYLDFGQTIYPQDIEYTAQSTSGVRYAKVTGMDLVDAATLTTVTGASDEVFRFTSANIVITEDV